MNDLINQHCSITFYIKPVTNTTFYVLINILPKTLPKKL
jgi:hypothetical protein